MKRGRRGSRNLKIYKQTREDAHAEPLGRKLLNLERTIIWERAMWANLHWERTMEISVMVSSFLLSSAGIQQGTHHGLVHASIHVVLH